MKLKPVIGRCAFLALFAKTCKPALVCLMLGAVVTGARADDSGASMFSFSGFGTLGAVHSNASNADFTGNSFQPKGAGYSHPWAATVDSKLGVQMDAKFNDKLSAVVQCVSQYGYDSTYTPQIEWANVKYQFTKDFYMRIGRFAASTFLLSEASLVGYTYPWIRPPQEVYLVLPVTNKDGIDATYSFAFGAVADTVDVSYGRNVHKLPQGDTEITADHYLDVHNAVEYGPTTVRVGYMSSGFETDGSMVASIVDGFMQFGNAVPGPAGQQALLIGRSITNSRFTVVTIGASYEPGDWFLMAEWAKIKYSSDVADADSAAWYVTGGYRIAAFTPYLTVAHVNADKHVDGIPTAGLSPPLASAAAALNGALDALANRVTCTQDSISAGVRWDLKKNVALKMQYDHLRIGSGNNGRLGNVQPGFQSGGTVDVFSLAVDFVF